MHAPHHLSSAILSQFGNQRGLTFLELFAVLGIIGLLAAMSLPNINPHSLDLKVSTSRLAENLRMARSWATGRGVHFQATLAASSYTILRLQDDDGDREWAADTSVPAQEFTLPDRISLSTSDQSAIEFTTRGLVVPGPGELVAAVQEITLTDTTNGKTRQIIVWPSGQIQEP